MSARIFGIVNLTTDSFSDGGRYLDPPHAIAHARQLVEQGADVIDLGPASSHPSASYVGAAEEIRRLEPVLDELAADDVAVSIDSYEPEAQRFALSRGVAYLNDITGFGEPSLYPDLARSNCRLVVMHSIQRHGPATVQASDPATIWARMFEFFDERIATLTQAGIARERLILDPGMGFFLGDTPEPSLRVLASIEALERRYGVDVLISVSRKSFLRGLTGRPTAAVQAATLAAELYAVSRGVSFVRTHDVAALVDGLRVWQALELQARNSKC